jgi:hypothetical protein
MPEMPKIAKIDTDFHRGDVGEVKTGIVEVRHNHGDHQITRSLIPSASSFPLCFKDVFSIP